MTAAIRSIQRPTPLDPDWSEELGPDWEKDTTQALKVLLQVQVDQETVPDEVWDTIDESSRAGFLRNTLVNALSNYRQLVDAQPQRGPSLHDNQQEEHDVQQDSRGPVEGRRDPHPRPPANLDPTE